MLGVTGGAPFTPALAAQWREASNDRSIDKNSAAFDDKNNWLLGEELTKTCMRTYTQSATGLGAEIVYFHESAEGAFRRKDESGRSWYIDKREPLPVWTQNMEGGEEGAVPVPPLDARNILRPETVESLFIGWRLTHNPIYRYDAICPEARIGWATSD